MNIYLKISQVTFQYLSYLSNITSNNQRLGSAFDAVTVKEPLADFHLLSLAKINIFLKKIHILAFYKHI